MKNGIPNSTRTASRLAFVLFSLGIAIPVWDSAGVHLIHLVLLAISPVLLVHSYSVRYLRWLWGAMALWALSQILADLIAGNGLSSLVVIGPLVAVTVSALHWFVFVHGVRPALLLFAIGVGWILLSLQGIADLLATGNPWKFGLASPVALTLLSLLSLLRVKRLVISLALIALAATSFLADSRISAGVLAVAALINIVGGGRRNTRAKTLMVLSAALAVLLAAYFLYPSIALSGFLGERAALEQQQLERNGGNFLFSARKELWQNLYLIANNPLTGIGGYASVDASQSWGAINFVDKNIVPLNINDINYLLFREEGMGYHPHSQALESILFAGVGALPAWIFLAFCALSLLTRDIAGKGVIPGVESYLGLGALWSSLFSPITPGTVLSLSLLFFVASIIGSRREELVVTDHGLPIRMTIATQPGSRREVDTDEHPSRVGLS